MEYGRTVTVATSFEDTVTRVRQALAGHGFGVLTEIDVQATLKVKLGEEMEPYLILGACNPALAKRALAEDRSIGLLLPCNVVVRGSEGRTVVQVLDPQTMVQLTGLSTLQVVADEAAERLDAVLASLPQH
ncbi:ABC transporter ATP-binding protein [Streptomyces tateyamensis]|uniref:ABC transporter ATP-binding protein n=1 Tax=Streptomyces tateyamensis TaxID=565073 RepID=A0A2V4NP48_9ACTN|nr:DUF302 domain-containing protein [Streptomyces tateyamensis]PYC82660.1 ABC transporter ATP-binding protein [Streptomyces tateyamensis]